MGAVELGVFLASEAVKIVMAHLAQKGSLNNLTEAQAKAWLATFQQSLPPVQPTPEQLEAQGGS
jgi:hypothetical protein